MNWQDKTQVKKGNLGERIVENHLLKNGFVPYKAIVDNAAHPFDRLVATKDKKSISIAEIKTKAHRTYYPDTGIDLAHYNDYTAISLKHNMAVYLFFVDEHKKEIYGNFLSELDKPCTVTHNNKILQYPFTQGNIRYFPLCKMQKISELTEVEAKILCKLSARNYDYSSTVFKAQ